MFLYQGCEYSLYLLCVNVFTIATLVLHHFDNPSTSISHEYDYIIVGSGTAGSLIGYRLATEADESHVILEAGPDRTFLTDIPVLSPLLQTTLYDWQYETVAQDNACRSLKGKKSKWPRGKIVGGSAIMNNMIHIRGNLTHYVNWFHNEYSFEDIVQQFYFIEKHILHVDQLRHTSYLADALMDAALSLGYVHKDVNEEFDLGFMKPAVNQRNGQRWSTSHAVVRDNIVANTRVVKILMNENTAYGVMYLKNGKTGTIKARKGVILSAGAIETPKLLLLSGIGPGKHLKEVKIPLIKELPVGKNLQDHATTGLDLILFNRSIGMTTMDLLNPINIFKYVFSGTGPFTSPGCEVVAFLSTNSTASADLQFMVLPMGVTSDKGARLRDVIGINDEIWKGYFSKFLDKQAASILPIVLHPKSRGEVKLKNNNPLEAPLIDPNYFKEKEDIDVIIKGLEIIKELIDTESMKRLGAYMNPEPFPTCKQEMFSKEYWECYVRELTITSYHPIGTCKMGPRDSKESVVDHDFKLIGVDNLFIADASVLPTMPSGNPNAAIALMANLFYERHFSQSCDHKCTCQRKYLYSLENICPI